MWGSDDFREHRKEQKKRRAERLPRRIELIMKLKDFGFTVEALTEYQYRVSRPEKLYRKIDIYPIHLRYHDINKNKRGQIKGEKKLIAFIVSKFNFGFEEKRKVKAWITENYDDQING